MNKENIYLKSWEMACLIATHDYISRNTEESLRRSLKYNLLYWQDYFLKKLEEKNHELST